MPAIHRKLVRDLWNMKGQALAIALVVASGIATFVLSVSTLVRSSHKGDLLPRVPLRRGVRHLKRAPESLRESIGNPRREQAQTRVVAGVKLDLANGSDPMRG